MFDSHIHSELSSDSEMIASEAIQSLKEQQIGGIFTEHYDLGYPEPGKFLFDPIKYFEEYSKIRSKKLLLGVELGLVPGNAEAAKVLIQNHPFDYVIGSIHVVENIDIFYPEFYKDRSKVENYLLYFQTMERCIYEFPDFDALGHIDYIARYAPYQDSEIWSEIALRDSIDCVLLALIETNRVLEFNTRRIASQSDFEAILPVYQRYYELGGRFVTIGSDAHTPKSVGWKCKEAQENLASLGLKTVVFRNRKRIIL